MNHEIKTICYAECEFCPDQNTCQGTGKGRQSRPLDYEHELDGVGL